MERGIVVAIEREPRLVTECRVEFPKDGRTVEAVTEDLSRTGAYVRSADPLASGQRIPLSVTLPDGTVAKVEGVVRHALLPAAAQVLGREPGMGIQFDGEVPANLVSFLEVVAERAERAELDVAEASTGSEGPRILVADASERMRSRIVTGLTAGGFEVEAVASATGALEAMRENAPDALLLGENVEGMDSWELLHVLFIDAELRGVLVAYTSEVADDLTRLRAYRLGVRDFIPRPFTDEELVIRLSRMVEPRGVSADVHLHGTLGEIAITTLLSLIDFERKSGLLLLLQESAAVRVSIAEGQVRKVEGPGEDTDSLANLRVVMGWTEGSFEFRVGQVDVADEVGMTTQQLLLDAARLNDEEAKDDEGSDDEGEVDDALGSWG